MTPTSWQIVGACMHVSSSRPGCSPWRVLIKGTLHCLPGSFRACNTSFGGFLMVHGGRARSACARSCILPGYATHSPAYIGSAALGSWVPFLECLDSSGWSQWHQLSLAARPCIYRCMCPPQAGTGGNQYQASSWDLAQEGKKGLFNEPAADLGKAIDQRTVQLLLRSPAPPSPGTSTPAGGPGGAGSSPGDRCNEHSFG